MNMKLKWGTARRGAVVLAVVGLAASAGLLTAGAAMAGVGADPGALELIQGGVAVTSGSLTASTATTLESTVACPSGFTTSAQVYSWSTSGTPSNLGAVSGVTSAGIASADWTIATEGPIGGLLASEGPGYSASNPGTVEWVAGCYSAASGTGSVTQEASIFITANANGTWTASSSGPVITGTTTTLTYSPTTVTTTTSVQLQASVEAADSTFQAGTVEFESNGSEIASVGVNAGNANVPATTTTTFPTAGTYTLTAVFTPTNSTSYSGSTGTNSVSVEQAGTSTATGSPVPITVTIAPSGSLTVTVVNTSVPLTLNAAGTAATGTLGNVTVTDSRNSYPGWSVSGQQSNYTEAAPGTATISGDEEGWVPAAVGTLVDGAKIGSSITPGTTPDGLGDTGGVLISAVPGDGFGTNVANAALTLDIPTGTPAGSYSGSMNVTYLSVGP